MSLVTRPAGFRLPPLGRLLPRYPGSVLLANGLNQVVMRRLDGELLERLDGRCVRIAVTDADLEFSFRVLRGRCSATHSTEQPAVRLAATAADFAAIAAGTIDTDTLFFQRRLALEGDVELATMVKNALDAVEFPLLRRALRSALGLLPGYRVDS